MVEIRQPVWTNAEDAPPLPEGWHSLPTAEACIQLKPGKLFNSRTVFESGSIPVLNQSETGFLGYHDEEPGVTASPEAPVVTFANHTCAMRLMKQPFSSIQNIFPKVGKPGVTETVYFYYASLGRVGLSDYKGHHPVFRKAHIPIPPLPIQRRIAGILSAFDDLIENSQRRIKILEEMARRLYREWFVHFRFPGHEGCRFVDSPLGGIPEGWEAVDLGTVCLNPKGIQTGPFGSQLHESDYSAEGVPVVMPKDLIDYRIRVQGAAFIPEETADRLDRHRMQSGDIVYGRRGDIGRRAFIMPHQVGWLCGTGCLRIRPNPQLVDPWYLFNALGQDDVVALIRGRAQGVTMPNLNTSLLESVPLRLPPSNLQCQFSALSYPLATARENLSATIDNLRRTRDLLLPRLLSGQIDVEALPEPTLQEVS